jgi:hypothetical protein
VWPRWASMAKLKGKRSVCMPRNLFFDTPKPSSRHPSPFPAPAPTDLEPTTTAPPGIVPESLWAAVSPRPFGGQCWSDLLRSRLSTRDGVRKSI